MRGTATGDVSTWRRGNAWIERYRHAPGPTAPVAAHAHDEYQIGISFDAAGEYLYRGRRHAIAPGSVRLIQPGEMHASRDIGTDVPLTTHLLYLPQEALSGVVGGPFGSGAAVPIFARPIVADGDLAHVLRHLFLLTHRSPTGDDPDLAWDCTLMATLSLIVGRHTEQRIGPPMPGAEPAAIGIVRAYLHAHVAERVPLRHLADLVGLSPPYLVRAFTRAVGLPPHRYQIGLRVAQAKRLIGAGHPPREVALAVGFADQSHLGRHFKRLVGVSPGAYRPDSSSRAIAQQEVE